MGDQLKAPLHSAVPYYNIVREVSGLDDKCPLHSAITYCNDVREVLGADDGDSTKDSQSNGERFILKGSI